MVELTEVEAAQMTNCQAQLEEAIVVMSQEIGTIKQLFERLLVPRALMMTKGDIAIEERSVEQQATKTTTRGKTTSGSRTNSQQVPWSQAKSTHSTAPNSKKTHTKVGPSVLTMERYQASHRGSLHRKDHRRKSKLEEHRSRRAMCSTDLARTMKKIYAPI